MMASNAAFVDELVTRVEKVPGWGVKRTREGFRILAPDGGTVNLHRHGDADARARRNLLADLRKLGLEQAEAELRETQERDRKAVLAADAKRNTTKTAAVKRNGAALVKASGEYAIHDDYDWVRKIHPLPAVRQMYVTPEIALEWLDRNKDNRPMKRGHWWWLRQLMIDERFLVTHQGIAFDNTGKLIDGQHRLKAIFDSGMAQVVFVFVGMDPAVYAVIDTHAKRTATDVLAPFGVKNASQVGAVMRMVWRYDELREDPVAWRGTSLDNDQIVAQFRETKDDPQRPERLAWAVREAANTLTSKKGIPLTPIATTIYVARRGNTPVNTIEEFLHGYRYGYDLGRGSPIAALRHEAEGYQELGPGMHRPRPELVLGQVIVAYNAYIEGRSIAINSLRRRVDDPIPPVTLFGANGKR